MTGSALVIVIAVAALLGAAIAAWAPAAVVLHEAGHAATARLLGCRVVRIELGRGRTWSSRRWRGVDMVLAGLLTEGRVLVARDHEAGWRWRFAAICAGGPLTNVLVASIALAVAANQRNLLLGALVYTFAVANAVHVVSLVSFDRAGPDDGPPRPSDGRQIVRMLRGDAAFVRASWVGALEHEIVSHLRAGRVEEARAGTAALRSRAPESLVARLAE